VIVFNHISGITPKGKRLAPLLLSKTAKDGGFARVVVLSDTTVLKATSCQATNLLFSELRAMEKAGQTVPSALPAAFRDHGECLMDSDRIRYRAWEIERLFEPNEQHLMQKARIRGQAQLEAVKSGYGKTMARLIEPLLGSLNQAIQREAARIPAGAGWKGSYQMASALAALTQGPLRDTFIFLEDFVQRHKVELDMLTRGNILLDMFGQPVLSDPVTNSFAHEEPISHSASPELWCLLAQAPQALLPEFRVKTQWRSTLGMTSQALVRVRRAFEAEGLRTRCFRWDDLERLALLKEPPQVQNLWDIPKEAELFRADRYDELFLGS